MKPALKRCRFRLGEKSSVKNRGKNRGEVGEEVWVSPPVVVGDQPLRIRRYDVEALHSFGAESLNLLGLTFCLKNERFSPLIIYVSHVLC